MNQIAAQYTNSKYVQSTRHIGYSGQTEWCDEDIGFNNTSICPMDEGYINDYELLNTALGSSVGRWSSTGEATHYFIASRWTDQPDITWFNLRSFDDNGTVGGLGVCVYFNDGLYDNHVLTLPIRPVLTLKSLVSISSGDGKSAETAYHLS